MQGGNQATEWACAGWWRTDLARSREAESKRIVRFTRRDFVAFSLKHSPSLISLGQTYPTLKTVTTTGSYGRRPCRGPRCGGGADEGC